MLLTLYTLPQLAVSAKILGLLMVVTCGAVPSMPSVRSVALYSHCSFGYLRIYPNGTVMAKDNGEGDQYQNLTISSEGLDLKLLIYAPEVRRYLCFNPKYRLVGLPISKRQALGRHLCLFNENMLSDGYNTYQSVVNSERYITFNGNGVQPGTKKASAKANRKCRRFLKRDRGFSIVAHNSRVAGTADMDMKTMHHKRAHNMRKSKILRYPEKHERRHEHSRHLRRRKHYGIDTT